MEKPKKDEPFSTQLPASLKVAISSHKERTGNSVKWIVRVALEKYLGLDKSK